MRVPSAKMTPGFSFPAGPNRISFMRLLLQILLSLMTSLLTADLQGPSRLLTQLLGQLRELNCHSCLGHFELQRYIWSEQTYGLYSSDVFQDDTVTGPVWQNCVNVVALCCEESLDSRFARLRLICQFCHIIRCRILLVVLHLRDFAGAPLMRSLPWPRAVDRFAIDLQPIANLREPLFHDHRNSAVGSGADIQQQVASTADRIDEYDY